MNVFSLRGTTALVTGCRRGIGRAITEALAEAGADIVGVSASLERESGVERAVRAHGRSWLGLKVDLGDRSERAALIERLDRESIAVDILVNNAGTILRRPAAEHGDELWDRVIDTNLTAPFELTRALGGRMLQRQSTGLQTRGKVIFIASLLSFQGGINVPGYAASKGGIAQLTKAFANEWAGRGVNVNAIAPGYVATDNTAALREDLERNTAITARIPAGRWGVPEDFKGPAVFLASAASDYVHGTILTVDGGWMGR